MTMSISITTNADEIVVMSENALRVLKKRYLKKDERGNVTETPESLFRRVAKTAVASELIYNPAANLAEKEDEFFRVMAGLEFLPNSPTLLNAGEGPGQMVSCFVVPVEDSVEKIFEAVKDAAIIHKNGGGTGFSFSGLRPMDDCKKCGEKIGGPASFIKVFSTATDIIRQGGIRKGCNIGLLSVGHPEILEFIEAKDDPLALTNFCLAVVVTTQFMEAVKSDSYYELVDPHTKKVTGKLKAKEVLNKIASQSWKTGDPGVVFIDRINQDNPTPNLGTIESVSGCAEQPLLPYESCILGSINLARMLTTEFGAVIVDYPRIARTVKTAVNFLDNIIDSNEYPLPQVEYITKQTRKIGLGVMGFADMLFQIGVPYNSDEALKIAADVMSFIRNESLRASEELARERGAFPAFKGSRYDLEGKPPLRNATCNTIAPTGTISLIADCSHSIEPNYAMVFVRNILEGERLLEVNPYFEQAAKREGVFSEDLLKKMVIGDEPAYKELIPERIKRSLATTHDVEPERHVMMQAVFQKYTDNGVAKMINLPSCATVEDVADVFMLAYEQGVKGVTCYRDSSRELQSLSAGEMGVELVSEYFNKKTFRR